MTNFILSLMAVIFYFLAVMLQLINLFGKQRIHKFLVLLLGFIAVTSHAWLLHRWIDTSIGQNLTFFNVLSLVTWLISVIVLITALRKPLENLLVIILPITAICISLVIAFPGNYVIDTGADPKRLVHILISILAFSVLCVAALQAVLLAFQESQLRRRQHCPVTTMLPPLETMELLMFQMIWVGFILLSFVIASGFSFLTQIFTPPLLPKTILTFIAWIVFATLLFGRYVFGWRGRTAIRWTLTGVILLIISYFGSRLLLELLI